MQIAGARLAGAAGRARRLLLDRVRECGALLDDGTLLYVVDAIERLELAFAIPDGPQAGSAIPVTAGIRRDGGGVIRETVEAIARQYQFTPSPR